MLRMRYGKVRGPLHGPTYIVHDGLKENPAPGIMLAGIKMESVRHAKDSFQYMYDEKTPETPTWAKSTSLRHFLDMPLLLLFSDEEGELSALSPHL